MRDFSKIAIVGAGANLHAIAQTLAEYGHGDIMVVTPDQARKMADKPEIDMEKVKRDLSDQIEKYTPIGEKQFICKGRKHHYRNDTGIWICQCGKTLHNYNL